ncbi:MAG TPA: hypothetical protein ENN19_01730 [Chloroflexi bacterium]|nr:hypothetical protein [Chloroflexota bacterium]
MLTDDRQPVNQGMIEDEKIRVPCEVYSRIVGYLRPVQNWHQGKQQEFQERKTFRTPGTVLEDEDPAVT